MSLFDKFFPDKSSPLPIETEPLVGYRSWKLQTTPEGVPILQSCVQDFCWPPFEAVSGDVDNGHGIYAWKIPNDAWRYCDASSIVGEVFLWGKIDEHNDGYRAEFAYPKELHVLKDFDVGQILRLEETYGVPVIIKEDWESQTASNFGATARNTTPAPPMQFSGLSSAIMEIIRDVIYDREALHGSVLHLFCLPCGQMTYDVGGMPLLKSYERTNMVMCGSIPAPNVFTIKAIRCAFLEKDGSPVPIQDPIYWESRIELRICAKSYWASLAAYVADPAILLGATDWSKIPADERAKLIEQVTAKLTSNDTAIPGGGTIQLDGVAILQQQAFQVIVTGFEKWKDSREVLVALEGLAGRAVF